MKKYANEFSMFVTGEPKPQARPRFARVGNFVKTYSPKSVFFALVHNEAVLKGPALPMLGPLSLKLQFYMPRPLALQRGKGAARVWHESRPDLDNMEKAVMDAMTQARVWNDDGQVCEKSSAKVLAPIDGEQRPGVFVWVAQILDVEGVE